jgi:uncharacterized membrane protein YuzA (DUF378 family)
MLFGLSTALSVVVLLVVGLPALFILGLVWVRRDLTSPVVL